MGINKHVWGSVCTKITAQVMCSMRVSKYYTTLAPGWVSHRGECKEGLIKICVRVFCPLLIKKFYVPAKSPSFCALGNGKNYVGIPDCKQVCAL